MFRLRSYSASFALLLVAAALAGLATPALARRGADDYYPHNRSGSGVFFARDLETGRWRWFTWTETQGLRYRAAGGSVHWYAVPHGPRRSSSEWHDRYDDSRSRSRDDDNRRGRDRGYDDNPGQSNRRGRGRGRR